MPLPTFTLFTVAGTLVWSTVLIALGAALGTQYELVERYSQYLNYAVYAAVAVGIALLVVRRVRGRNRPAEGNGSATG